MWDQLHSRLDRKLAGLRTRLAAASTGQRRAMSIGLALAIVALFGVAAVLPRMTSAAESNLLANGGFEHGFRAIAGCGDVGAQWHCFTNGGAANYGFYDDQWSPVVAEGKHSQLIEINTHGIDAPSNDRYAGLYQTVKVVPGARYKFSMRGVIRTTNMEGDPWRYSVQVGWLDGPSGDWQAVDNWTDVGWYTYYPRTEPGSISHFQTSLVPHSGTVTLFVRVWKKWGMAYEELDVNFDDIALIGPPAYGAMGPHPGVGGPIMPWAPPPAAPGPGYPMPSGPGPAVHAPVAPSYPTYEPDYTLVCGGPDLVYNGNFEHGFNTTALGDVGKGWGAFTNGGAAAYGFYQEQWDVVVADGKSGQLIEINTKSIYPTDADRYAGIYQRIGGLHPGATYELNLRGLLRGVGNEQEPYRFAAQWGLSTDADWRSVKEWTEMDLGSIYKRTEPGPLAVYSVRFVAPAPNVVLFIRAWNKWAVTDVELDFNLDAIRVNGCMPVGHAPIGYTPVGPGGPPMSGPGMGGPVGGPAGGPVGGPVGGVCLHTVKPGEMLSRIAQQYGVSADALARANGIRNPNMIYVGQQLDVSGCQGGMSAAPVMPSAVPVARSGAPGPVQGPGQSGPGQAGRNPATGAPSMPANVGPGGGQPSRPAPGGEITYTVQRGDSLGIIAQRYGVDAGRLAALNGIRNPNLVYAGQVLRIPVN